MWPPQECRVSETASMALLQTLGLNLASRSDGISGDQHSATNVCLIVA